METPNGRDPDLRLVDVKEENKGELSVLERLQSPTPKFFKKLRTIGLILAAAGGALVTAPVTLPAIVITMGGYLIVAGTVASAVSQAAVEGEGGRKKNTNN